MSAKILLCTATSIEARACERAIAQAEAQSRFEVLKSGMGLENAARALRSRLAARNHSRPTLIVSTGFAGSWSPDLSFGSWAIGQTIEKEEGTKQELETTSHLLSLPNELRYRLQPARIISLTHPKSAVQPGDPHPLAVDMESHAWAATSRDFSIPFLVLRLISDSPEAPMPEAVSQFAQAFTSQGSAQRFRHAARGLKHAVSEPQSLARFVGRSACLPKLLTDGWRQIALQN